MARRLTNRAWLAYIAFMGVLIVACVAFLIYYFYALGAATERCAALDAVPVSTTWDWTCVKEAH